MKKYLVGVLIICGGVSLQAVFRKKTVDETKIELGRMLFFDPILSKDSTISCGSCHKPEFAFADSAAFSVGIGGKKGVRNSPSAMNMALRRQNFFWDGRARTLEEQALKPIEDPTEMNLKLDEALHRLRESNLYRQYFQTVFKRLPDTSSLADAISAFERSLETSDSPFDEWKFTDNPNAVNEAVKRGFDIFAKKGKCAQCHFGADFTANEFRNIGLFDGKKLKDSGRAGVTKMKEDLGKFKTSSLRNLAVTAPYMHNGMFKTLDEVIGFYDDPSKIVPGNKNRDSVLLKPLGLTKQEKADLKEFLIALTDKRFFKRK